MNDDDGHGENERSIPSDLLPSSDLIQSRGLCSQDRRVVVRVTRDDAVVIYALHTRIYVVKGVETFLNGSTTCAGVLLLLSASVNRESLSAICWFHAESTTPARTAQWQSERWGSQNIEKGISPLGNDMHSDGLSVQHCSLAVRVSISTMSQSFGVGPLTVTVPLSSLNLRSVGAYGCGKLHTISVLNYLTTSADGHGKIHT